MRHGSRCMILAGVSPLFAILAKWMQLHENTTTSSLVFATLTSRVKRKSFACHSYRKHPGWGYPFAPRAPPLSSNAAAFDFSLALPPPLIRHLEKHLWRHMEPRAQSFDMVLVQFPLPDQHFRPEAAPPKHVRKVFLQQMVLLHQKPQNIKRLRPRQPVPLLLEILDQQRQEFRQLLLRRRKRLAAPVQLVKNLRVRLVFLLRPNHLGRHLLQKRAVLRANR